MKYLKAKAYKIMKLSIEWELYRFTLKYVIKNQVLSFWVRQFAIIELAYLPIQSALGHLKLRCFSSNQSRSVLTFFKLNRMRFKINIPSGLLSGIKKSS